jgi:hypothetical protein
MGRRSRTRKNPSKGRYTAPQGRPKNRQPLVLDVRDEDGSLVGFVVVGHCNCPECRSGR